ncbi:MAG: hypothetical protein AAF211_08690, partial [Myxococcota bacterium]
LGGGQGTAVWREGDSIFMAIADSPGGEWELRAAWTDEGWRFVEVNPDAGPWAWPLDVANEGSEPVIEMFMAGLQFRFPNPYRGA